MANETKPTIGKPASPIPSAPGVMTSAGMLPPEVESPNPFTPAPELDDSIVARPLVMPDFINIKLKNPQLAARWINWKAGDGLRFSQAQAQGWRVATKTDVADGTISPYMKEGGTKFVNGDLILMVIERAKYLGALKYKHNVAAALADAAILRAVSGKKAASEMSRVNAPRAQHSKVQVFSPDAVDLEGTPFKEAVTEAGRLGSGGRDTGTSADIAAERS